MHKMLQIQNTYLQRKMILHYGDLIQGVQKNFYSFCFAHSLVYKAASKSFICCSSALAMKIVKLPLTFNIAKLSPSPS